MSYLAYPGGLAVSGVTFKSSVKVCKKTKAEVKRIASAGGHKNICQLLFYRDLPVQELTAQGV